MLSLGAHHIKMIKSVNDLPLKIGGSAINGFKNFLPVIIGTRNGMIGSPVRMDERIFQTGNGDYDHRT
jgi:hypothetical protein